MGMTILTEYDKPQDIYPISYNEAGIPFYQCTPTAHTVTDDYGIVGYYEDTNTDIYNVKSLKVGGLSFSMVNTYAEMLATDDSFYYDGSNYIYFHRAGWEPVLADSVFIGATAGYSKGSEHPYYYLGNTFYPPLLEAVPAIKQSIDPLYFGLLKYQSVSPSFDNLPVPPLIAGEFDDWRSQNLWGQAARIMVNDIDNTYANFTNLISGYLEDDSTDFSKFSVKIQDLRKGLTQQVANNYWSQTVWTDLSDDDAKELKPVAYGTNYYCKTIVLNSEATSPATMYFGFVDTEFNTPSTGVLAYKEIDGVYTAISSGSITEYLSDGYISIPTASCNDLDGNLCDIVVTFTVETVLANGVSIIINLMKNHDGKPYVASFFNTAEISALAATRDTSLYIDDTTTLSKAIESICMDCDIRFFVQKTGLYTIRVYNSARAIDKTIPTYDWMDEPKVKNNGSEYLTSCVIKYKKDQNKGEFVNYDSSALGTYKVDAFNKYKTYKSKEFETGLTTEADAILKATTIMEWSHDIQDIITRTLPLKIYDVNGTVITDYSELEICDFIYCSPKTRIEQSDVWGVYEILSTSINIDKMTQELEFRYVREPSSFIQKLNNGIDVKIGFIGGSITEGAVSTTEQKRYSSLICHGLSSKYGCNVTEINTGISGTPSSFGAYRIDRKIIDELPDLVIIEFAVNDIYETSINGAEACVRKCINNGIPVFMLLTCTADGGTRQSDYIDLCNYYNISYASVLNDIYPYYTNFISSDGIHPNDYGHWLYSEISVDKIITMQDNIAVMPVPLIDDIYDTANYYNATDLNIPLSTIGNSLSVTYLGLSWGISVNTIVSITAKKICLFTAGKGGGINSITVSVDGGTPYTIIHIGNGWSYIITEIYSGSYGTHTISIVNNSGETWICAILYTT
jgi:hypothetical protein